MDTIIPLTTSGRAPVLIVEDSDEDFESLRWAMRRLAIHNEVVRCVDGDQALDFLYKRGDFARGEAARPAMVLLDLNLTTVDGREVLQQIKQDDALKRIPVVVWTSSSNPRDIDQCYQEGANSYIVKPTRLDKLLSTVALLERYWLGVVALPERGAGW